MGRPMKRDKFEFIIFEQEEIKNHKVKGDTFNHSGLNFQWVATEFNKVDALNRLDCDGLSVPATNKKWIDYQMSSMFKDW